MSPAGPSSPTTTSERSGAPPERSYAQQKDALQKANEVRSARAQLKRELKAGRVQIQGILLDPPENLQTLKVSEVLLAVPKYGRVKVNALLTRCRISPSKTLGGLSERQRHELVGNFRR